MSGRCGISIYPSWFESNVSETISRSWHTQVECYRSFCWTFFSLYFRWNEITVAVVFIFMIILWVTKDFSGTPGWDVIFRRKYISDGTVAILCGVLPMILPNANPLQSYIIMFALNFEKVFFRRGMVVSANCSLEWSGEKHAMGCIDTTRCWSCCCRCFSSSYIPIGKRAGCVYWTAFRFRNYLKVWQGHSAF